MRKQNSIMLITLFLLMLNPVFSQVSEREEQFVYSILADNGSDYSSTFSGEDSNTIYLTAGTDNFLTTMKSLVYYWPITKELKLDTDSLSIPLIGRLEIISHVGTIMDLKPVRFTFFNKKDGYEYNWFVAKGDDADKAYDDYSAMKQEYLDSQREWNRKVAEYQDRLESLSLRIIDLRRRGQDVNDLLEGYNELEKQGLPKSPQLPLEYKTPPTQVQEAFNINLPSGIYTIRLKLQNDLIVQGSERNLVVFDKMSVDMTGYDIIPADKWTRQELSIYPGSVLYCNGQTDIYIRPFLQDEYNELYYSKLVRNDDLGNVNQTRWIKTRQIPQALVELTGREPVHLHEKPYFVEHNAGKSLGYRIVPADNSKEEEPELYAYKISFDGKENLLRLHSYDSTGKKLRGSGRQIRLVSEFRGGWLLLFLSLFPLILWAVVLVIRKIYLKRFLE